MFSFKQLAAFGAFFGTCLNLVAQPTFVSTAPSNKNVVLEEFTGITCQFCPDGHRRAQEIYNNNPNRVVLINIHSGNFAVASSGRPELRTPWGNALDSLLPINGYPTGTVNRRNHSGRGLVEGRTTWATSANTVLAEASPVNVAARCSLDLDTREMVVKVEVYYTANGPGSNNRLNVLLTQDNIAGHQTGAAANPSAILPNGLYNHTHAFRHNLTPQWGDTISNNTAGSFQSFEYRYTLPANYPVPSSPGVAVPVVPSDIKVIAHITENHLNVLTGTYADMIISTATPSDLRMSGAAVSGVSLGTICSDVANTSFNVRNLGSETINNIEISYTINNGSPQTLIHNFNPALTTGQTTLVPVNISGLSGTNNLRFNINQINGQANVNASTQSQSINVRVAEEQTFASDSFRLQIRFDNYANETRWFLTNESTGQTILQGQGANADNGQTIFRNAILNDGDCYTLRVTDAAGDGMWDTRYGLGAFYATVGGQMLFADSTFATETGLRFKFKKSLPSSISNNENQQFNQLKLFPNPTQGQINLSFELNEAADTGIEIHNLMGQQVRQIQLGYLAQGSQNFSLNVQDLAAGTYLLVLRQNGQILSQRFSLVK